MADTLRVCVVDDKPDVRTLTAKALCNYSLRVDHREKPITFEVLPADFSPDCLNLSQQNLSSDIVILGEGISKQAYTDNHSQAACRCSDLAVLAVVTDHQQAASFLSADFLYSDYLLSPFSDNELRFAITKAAEKLIRHRGRNNSTSKYSSTSSEKTFTLLSTAAHELKAPAAAIEGYLQIVLNKSAGENPDFYRQMLERCLVRSQGMRHLINDILSIQAIRTGKKKRNLCTIDLVESARRAVENLSSAALKKNISLQLHCPEKLETTAARCEIDIILNNLLSNAIKYNIENGKVDLTLERRPGSDVIRVKDTGIGIAGQDQKKLFREFTRIKNEKTRDIPGTGLGLCIVKNIVELYEGTVDLRSTVDHGTIFTIRLPHGCRHCGANLLCELGKQ
jgi:signal transduction histidine kinase